MPISSFNSGSSRFPRRRPVKRRQNIRMGFVLSGRAKEPLHQGHGALPILRFPRDLLSPRARQLVEFGLAIGIAGTPARFDPAALFQAQERRIERPLVEIQRAAGYLLDAFGQPEAVLRPHGFERPQHHQIERALENARVSCRHPRGVFLGGAGFSLASACQSERRSDLLLPPFRYSEVSILSAWAAYAFFPTR